MGNLVGFTRNDVKYFEGTDNVGSPRIVLNEAGTVVKKINYSAFGEILEETNAEFQIPIGFAGGIFDVETKLVRFGFRDYDSETGRWTARDPILFEGRQGNLYVYVGNSPSMFIDPEGLDAIIAQYPGANGAGHVGIGINTTKTNGFYPVKGSHGSDMLTGQNVPGTVRADNQFAPEKIVVIKTTPEQDKKMQNYIDDRAKKPGHYNLYDRNCSQFTQSVLGSAGIKTSGTKFPKKLIKELKK